MINIASDMAKSYWQTGNIITAFGVIQMYTFFYALTEKPVLIGYIRTNWWVSLASLIGAPVLYGGLIYGCYYLEISIISPFKELDMIKESSFIAFIGRIAIIIMMMFMSITALIIDRILNKSQYCN